MAKVCVKAIVTGKVQGVFYRASTQSKARNLNLTGFAKNLSDGNVEVLACGEEEAVDALIEWLHKGPEQAEVTSVSAIFEPFHDVKEFEVY